MYLAEHDRSYRRHRPRWQRRIAFLRTKGACLRTWVTPFGPRGSYLRNQAALFGTKEACSRTRVTPFGSKGACLHLLAGPLGAGGLYLAEG
jgi:hypothetical protein